VHPGHTFACRRHIRYPVAQSTASLQGHQSLKSFDPPLIPFDSNRSLYTFARFSPAYPPPPAHPFGRGRLSIGNGQNKGKTESCVCVRKRRRSTPREAARRPTRSPPSRPGQRETSREHQGRKSRSVFLISPAPRGPPLVSRDRPAPCFLSTLPPLQASLLQPRTRPRRRPPPPTTLS